MASSKPISWSHSALKDFETCARKYHEVKVLKKYPFVQSDEAKYGDMVHANLEDYVKDGKPIKPEYLQFKPIVDAMLRKPGVPHAELPMALTADLKPTTWFAKDVWVRGKADILMIDDAASTVWCGDWKTGSDKYPDRDQLILMAIMVFQYYPHIQRVNGALIFLVKDSFIKLSVHRSEAEAHWWKYRERVAKIEAAHANGVWNPTQSGLCRKWCEVTDCEFNGNHHSKGG